MKLEVIKNNETSLIIDDVGKAIKDNGILAQGYRKAIEALRLYIEQTREIRKKLADSHANNSEINNTLYRSPQNIIAFSGKRGTGKTSSMLSFAEFLEKPAGKDTYGEKLKQENLPNLRTIVLSPLDPTMLENDQDILSVVLSRLLYKAEERWNQNTSFYHQFQDMEEEKNQLLKIGNACMNGILAIKMKKEIKGLSDLQRIGDSAILKKNLFDFVEHVNAFCLENEKKGDHSSYLVIPIDDTDCQIKKAHAVMEDIRRYLTLPNVIILMATDSDMLRNVFAQHYADEFKTGIDKNFLKPEGMQEYAEKYLTKLIPTTHRIYLPAFESIIHDSSEVLELGYYANGERDEDLITKTTREQREILRKGSSRSLDFDFQSKILSFIYKRTGIVFIEHTAYVNNIIPTTMRGLAHLLNLLCSMEEVEEVPFSEELSQEQFVKSVKKRLTSIKKNLDIFTEYFMNEWVPAKVHGDMANIIKGIDEQVSSNRIQYAYDEIYFKFSIDKGQGDRLPNPTYYDLMEILSAINGTVNASYIKKNYKSSTDFYNMFAIRTLLTIKNNRRAVKTKIRAVQEYERKLKEGSTDPLVFNCSLLGDSNSFPRDFKQMIEALGDNYKKRLLPIVEIYRSLLLDKSIWEGIQQRDIYRMQEFAWCILCNWDMQDAIYKSVEYKISKDDVKEDELWEFIRQTIANKNCGMLKDFIRDNDLKPEIWPKNYKGIFEEAKEEKSQINPENTDKRLEDDSSFLMDLKDNTDSILTNLGKERGQNVGVVVTQLEDLTSLLSDRINSLEEESKGTTKQEIESQIAKLKKEINKLGEYREKLTALRSELQNEDEELSAVKQDLRNYIIVLRKDNGIES